MRTALLLLQLASAPPASAPDIWVLCANAFGTCDHVDVRYRPTDRALELFADRFTALELLANRTVLGSVSAPPWNPGPLLAVGGFAQSLFPLWLAGPMLCRAGCAVTSGDYFLHLLVDRPIALRLAWVVQQSAGGPYPRREIACDAGPRGSSCPWAATDGRHGDVTTTPEPATVGLLATGLAVLGLVGLRRRAA